MRNLLRDENCNVINMYCLDCRISGKEWKDCIAVLMFDQTTRCMEHSDEFIKRNNL